MAYIPLADDLYAEGVITPPLKRVFSGYLLSDEHVDVFVDNSELSRWLTRQSLLDLGGEAITGPSEEGDELLSDMMTAEAVYALRRGGMNNSANWYTNAIERMIAVTTTLHPEIGEDEAARNHPSGLFNNRDEARTVLFSAMAITSQNINVIDNMRYAVEQYRYFINHGEFLPKSYGAVGGNIENNLARFNFIYNRLNRNLTYVRKILNLKLKMNELQSIGRKYGVEITGSELADETVYGSMIFGPKVGNGFLQNLMGNYEPVTIDLWFMRLWGRYTGTLVREEVTGDAHERLVQGIRRSMRSERMRAMMEKEGILKTPHEIREMDGQNLFEYARNCKRFWEKLRKLFVEGRISEVYTERNLKRARAFKKGNKDVSEFKSKLIWPGASESLIKSLGMPVDQPKNATMRRWIRQVVAKTIDKLSSLGYEITAADLQAILWYPEKEVFGKLTNRPFDRFNVSYDEAIIRIAQKEGIPDDEIKAALRTVGANGIRRHAGAEGSERGERKPDGWHGGRPVGAGEQTGRRRKVHDDIADDYPAMSF